MPIKLQNGQASGVAVSAPRSGVLKRLKPFGIGCRCFCGDLPHCARLCLAACALRRDLTAAQPRERAAEAQPRASHLPLTARCLHRLAVAQQLA